MDLPGMHLRLAHRYYDTIAKQMVAAVTTDKIRKSKGFPPSTSLADIESVLRPLGFTFEPTPGLLTRPSQNINGTPAEVGATYENMKRMYGPIPSHPRVGDRYVTELSDLTPTGFTVTLVDVVHGVKITGPDGASFVLTSEDPKIRATPGLNAWLKSQPAFRAFLGDAAPAPVSPTRTPAPTRTTENTGTCPVCFVNVKLKGTSTVLHGYTRPGTGETRGRCFGVGYPSFETSTVGTEDYLKALAREKDALKDKIRGVADSPSLPHPTFYRRSLLKEEATPDLWNTAVEKAIGALTSEASFIERVEDTLKARLRARRLDVTVL